ncbi:Pkinase-domain-containing protein [Rhizodiscina lignyota]|uniref:non-specific serine/threonine protein kinase n=1 Tax=Rhizodiscina lignyota TaxID=1504668 RepID=A0A9P4IH60_9PEZI|nr:Pkinase-domain-containing protein [Rhizodiscina lignyota]
MEQHARPPTRRRPFNDASSRANASHPSAQNVKPTATASPMRHVPHNESFVGNGTLAVRYDGSPQSPAVENKRLSTLSKEEQPNSKRNSAISNASTNASVPNNRRRKTHIGPWHLGRTIGKGGGSRVREVRHFVTGQKGAAKIISKQVAENARAISMANLVEQARNDPTLTGGKFMPFGLEREIVIMKLLDHKNIVKLYDVWENRNELYLIMEYVEGGELFDFIQNYPKLEERYVVYLFRQIIAALLYCHRIKIYHRDLKPENILIDKDTMEVKLVDFGMAALQPQGRYLTTPCGSPHYAAPDILSFKQYDGGKADVWSCGVILYVMLTGMPPFNFPPDPKGSMSEDMKLRALFSQIKRAEYIMPKYISDEAKDLIYRIFQVDPKRRIDIEEIWNHPFLHMYDQEFGLDPRLVSWIGPRPKVEGWQALRKHDIDRELLRNMRTLWHSEKEEVLVEKLLSDEKNHEKYFYSALLKHREEHLENYAGNGIEYSASDYQHIRAPIDPSEMPPLPVRSKSQYSILNNEHLHSAHSFFEGPQSDASYDPFRASRDAVIKSNKGYMNVTVHRGASQGSRALRPSSGALKPPSVQHAQRSSLRVEALKRGSQRSSRISNSSTSLKRGSSAHRLSPARQSISRSSLASSNWASSPPARAIKPNTLHKRAVNFSHLRRSSTASALTTHSRNNSQLAESVPEMPSLQKRPLSGTSVSLAGLASSPPMKPQIAIRSRKENLPEAPAQLRIRKAKDPIKDVDRAARKVSAELEKACEEAFFRSSWASSNRSSATDKQIGFLDTPPSSIAPHSPARINKAASLDRSEITDRPLPPLPLSAETPKTLTARELEETRSRIAARFAEANGDNADYFKDVLSHLDTLTAAMKSEGGKRAVSAPQPTPKNIDDLNYLPVISEEGRFADAEEPEQQAASTRNWTAHRAFTEPIALRARQRMQDREEEFDKTIRLVDASSPTPIAPLNIRKVSGASSVVKSAPARSMHSDKGTNRARRRFYRDLTIYTDQDSEMTSSPGKQVVTPTIATTAPVDTTTVEDEPPKAKKRGWFRRITSDSKEPDYIDRPSSAASNRALKGKKSKLQLSPLSDEFDVEEKLDTYTRPPTRHEPNSSVARTSESSEFPMRIATSDKYDSPAPSKGEEGVRRGLWKLFSKRKSEKDKEKDKEKERKKEEQRMNRGLRLGSPADFSSSSLGTYDVPSSSLATSSRATPVENQQSNWLARFLHIKPASRTMCFQVGRGRVRQELVRMLRDWKRFGVRDVTFDRVTNVVNWRIDKSNLVQDLKIKPVSVVAELFVVLEHGRRAQLTLVRFTQTRGAASSFRRVVEVIADVMEAKGLLCEDEERKTAMEEILA